MPSINTNSVAKLFVASAHYASEAPYRAPQVAHSSGSAFVIDRAKDGTILLITNAHVVENALDIQVAFVATGNQKHQARLRSFCPYRDVALVETNASVEVVPFQMRSSLHLAAGLPVIVVGYPARSDQPQQVRGVLSGRAVNYANELNEWGPVSYLQVSSPLFGGNSGGPLLTENGEVIGIAAASYLLAAAINYCISSDSVIGVMSQMMGTSLCRPPTFGLSTNRDGKGLYINRVLPTSCFYDPTNTAPFEDNVSTRRALALEDAGLLDIVEPASVVKRGDILKAIKVTSAGVDRVFEMDEFGTARYKDLDYRFSLADIEELTDYGCEVQVVLDKENGEVQEIKKARFIESPVTEWMLRDVFPTLEPRRNDYILVGGIIFMENRKDVSRANHLDPFARNLQVTEILSGGYFDNYKITLGWRLLYVNKIMVFTIDDVVRALNSSDTAEIVFHNRFCIKAPARALAESDMPLRKKYGFMK